MSARQRLQRRGAALRHRKMTTLANLLELPVMAAPPAHFYSLAPYNAGQQSYVWSPSSRSYASRSDGNLSGKSSPTSESQLPALPSSERSLTLSPQHTKILEKKTEQEKFGTPIKMSSSDNFTSLSPDKYSKPIKMDTPRPKNEKLQISQAESLASALGSRFGTEEYAAQEEDNETRPARKLTVDEGEEANEDCTDDDTFYDCKDTRVSASHADLLEGMSAQSRNFDTKSSMSAPSTPTGVRKLLHVLRQKTPEETVSSAKSMPAIALNPEELESQTKPKTQKQKSARDNRNSQKQKPVQPNRNKSSRKKR